MKVLHSLQIYRMMHALPKSSRLFFYPDGIIVDAFKQLIQVKRMLGAFSIQRAAALPIHVTACWTQTAHAVQDNGFRYSLLTQHPLNYESFCSIIDNRARIYSEIFRESMGS